MNRDDLYAHLNTNVDVLRDENVRRAFTAIDRADFVGDDYQPESYEDYALPMGHGQDLTKPSITAFMLELLGMVPGHSVLEIGAGSGWATALLAHMTGENGRVIGVEIIPELVAAGKSNLAKYNFPHASIKQAGNELGFADGGPYDRILVTADATEVPAALLDQLAENGRLVLPVNGTIVKVEKKNGRTQEERFPSHFNFRPLA